MLYVGSALLAFSLVQAEPQQGSDRRTWYQAYRDGRQQVQNGQWLAAIESLQVAKQTGPRPGRSIPFYGDVFDDFLPDYYLGIAYLNLKQYTEADAAFETIRGSQLIGAKDSEYARFTQDSRRASFEVLMAQAAQAFESKSFSRAEQLWTQARELGLDTAQVDDFLQRVAAIQNEQKGPSGAAPSAAPTPAVQVAGTPVPQSQPTVVPTAQSSPPAVGRPTATRTSAVPARPGSEQTGMAAFFSGDYQRAASILSALAAGGASPRAAFYLACSRAALVLIGGADPATLVDARTQFARLDLARFAADRRFISPRVLEFLQGGS